jgi:4-amino-4-deoxy-L-arabinose transferase-like glycosyltransferase
MAGVRAKVAAALSRRRWTAGAIAAGLALRVAALVLLSKFPFVGDERSYSVMAGQLLDGVRFAPDWPPGLPYYLAFFQSFLGRGQVVAMAAMIPWYLAFSAVLFALVMRIGGRRAANIALWAFALYPTFIYHSVVPLTQIPVAACLLLVALLILVLRGRRSLSIPAGIGAALGAAVLMRPSVVFLALGVPVFIMVRWRSVKGGLVALGVAAALVAPWLLKAKAMTGDFVFVNYATSRNLYVGNNEWTPLYKTWWFGSHDEAGTVPRGFAAEDARIRALPPAEEERTYRDLATDHIQSEPWRFAVRTLNRIRTYFAFDTYTGTVLGKFYRLPAALGLSVIALDALFYIALMAVSLLAFHAPRGLGTGRVTRATLLWIVAAYAVPYWIAFSHPTYHIPVVPLLAVPGALLLAQLAGMDQRALATARQSLRKRRAMLIALAVFLAVQVEWVIVMGVGFLDKG